MKRTSLLCLAFAALVVIFVSFGWNSKAQITNPAIDFERSPQTAEAFDSLIETAKKQGSVRAIVGLRFDFKPVGELNEMQKSQKMAQIKDVQNALLARLEGTNTSSVKLFDYMPFLAAEFDLESLLKMRSDAQITSIQLDEAVAPTLAESVPLVGAPAAWSTGFTGSGWSVAVLDTGVDKNHSFLTGKVISEACYSSNIPAGNVSSVCPGGVTQSTGPNSGLNCSPSISGCDHGTHVGGIAAGTSAGFSGVARNANLIAVQVFSRFGNQSDCGAAPAPCALSYASDQIFGLERVLALSSSINIAAANMSLGGSTYPSVCDANFPAQKTAIDNLRSVGIATVIASGNSSNPFGISTPACISSAISVGNSGDGSFANGSTATLNLVMSDSNSASFLSLLAPGRWINSSLPGGIFRNFNGTSMAAPHVAGGWAILKHKKPTATVTEILNAFTSTGLPITDTRNGIVKPRIRVDAALQAISGGGCPATAIIPGQTINGSLATTDCVFSGSTRYVDVYSFNGTAGQRIAISHNSAAFDAYLYLVNSSNQILAEDDDGGGGTNARIPATSGFFTLPTTATYSIYATSLGANATGAYSISLVNEPTSCSFSVTPIGLNYSASGGSGSFQVNTQPGCAWSTTVNAPLLLETNSILPKLSLFSGTSSGNFQSSSPAELSPEAIFLNSAPITINDRPASGTPGTASLYPSSIHVSGMTGTVTSVDATLNGVSHTFPDDIDVVLVSPSGHRAVLMSDAGGSSDIVATNLTFSQNATVFLPDVTQITSGTYRPTNFNGNATLEPGGIDNFPSPGPGQANFATDLSAFNGTAPNGTWSLYVVDDENVDAGSVATGWALGITSSGGGTAWINVTSGSSGTSTGPVNYSVTNNSSTSQRVGTITVNGQTHTVTQSGFSQPPSTRKPFDFDGDGRSDIGIFRTSNGQWWYLRSSDLTVRAFQFGVSTDKITPADFTGDGKTDIAFFRPSTGQWFVLRSEDSAFYAFGFGTNGDIPAPGDFDGDGKADAAVFRPSNGTWYILRSSDQQVTIRQFGAAGDKPAVADFDGDGKADISVWKPNVGQFWRINSGNSSVSAFQFGAVGDKPVQGDYTGDGKADVAVFRPSINTWFVLRSEDLNYFAFPFGAAGDIPAPGDYDGDGKFDAAIFRPSQATWYVNLSGGGILIRAFGANGDQPVPGAFIP